jgi:hypothetical protein
LNCGRRPVEFLSLPQENSFGLVAQVEDTLMQMFAGPSALFPLKKGGGEDGDKIRKNKCINQRLQKTSYKSEEK